MGKALLALAFLLFLSLASAERFICSPAVPYYFMDATTSIRVDIVQVLKDGQPVDPVTNPACKGEPITIRSKLTSQNGDGAQWKNNYDQFPISYPGWKLLPTGAKAINFNQIAWMSTLPAPSGAQCFLSGTPPSTHAEGHDTAVPANGVYYAGTFPLEPPGGCRENAAGITCKLGDAGLNVPCKGSYALYVGSTPIGTPQQLVGEDPALKLNDVQYTPTAIGQLKIDAKINALNCVSYIAAMSPDTQKYVYTSQSAITYTPDSVTVDVQDCSTTTTCWIESATPPVIDPCAPPTGTSNVVIGFSDLPPGQTDLHSDCGDAANPQLVTCNDGGTKKPTHCLDENDVTLTRSCTYNNHGTFKPWAELHLPNGDVVHCLPDGSVQCKAPPPVVRCIDYV